MTMKGNKKADGPAPAVPADSIPGTPRDSMAGNAENSAYDTLPVTVGNLKQNLPAMLAPIMQAMSDQFEDRLKQERDATTKQINEANAGMMSTIKQYLEQLNASINQNQGGGGEGAPQQPQDQKAQLLQMLQPSLERALNKFLGGEDVPQAGALDQQTSLIRKMIDREAQKVATKLIRQGMNKGLLFPDEVADVIGDGTANHDTLR